MIMKRKIISALALVFALCLTLAIPAFAESCIPDTAVVDGAKLLSQEEERELTEKLESISQAYGSRIVIATFYTIGNDDVDDYIQNYYDGNDLGYGATNDGILLMLVMDIREFRILSNGAAADALTLDRIDKITDAITPDLSDGNYYEAFDTFADKCEYYLDGHINGFPFDAGKSLAIALVVGLVIGLIVANTLKAQLKSVRMQTRAHDYLKAGSMQLTYQKDLYLYRTVQQTRKQTSNSNSGSSGGSRNVGGGKF
jgi:uncharacterized protein